MLALYVGVALVVAGLRAIGVDAEELPDGWRVTPGPGRTHPVEALIETRGDHRIAMAFAIAAATGVAEGVVIDDPACASVSYATFWSDLAGVIDSHAPAVSALAAAR